jgi:hypothetical protein
MKYFYTLVITVSLLCTLTPAEAYQADSSERGRVAAVAKTTFLAFAPDKRIKVYPNPVKTGDVFTIDVPEDLDEVTIFLYNTVGKVIHTEKTRNKKIEIDVPRPGGVYLLRLIAKQKVIAVEKLVVKE